MDNKLLTQKQAADFLNVSPRTLESWRRKRTGPRYTRYSNRCLRYSERELADWLASRANRETEEAPDETKG
jgi:hypothetical protein